MRNIPSDIKARVLRIQQLAMEIPFKVADVFVYFAPNVNTLSVRIYLGGWTTLEEPDRHYIYLDAKGAHQELELAEKAINILLDLAGMSSALDGAGRIWQERQRQIGAEGYKPEDDAKYDIGELATAAAAYLFAGDCLANAKEMDDRYECTPESLKAEILAGAADTIGWPWDEQHLKVSSDPVRNYEKAGALIAAEIDRLQAKKSDREKSDAAQRVPTSERGANDESH